VFYFEANWVAHARSLHIVSMHLGHTYLQLTKICAQKLVLLL